MATSIAMAQSAERLAAASAGPVEEGVTTVSCAPANQPGRSGAGRDSRRAWVWWFLLVLTAWQFYFVRELAAAFALFAIAFAALALVAAGFYLLIKAGEQAFARVTALRQADLGIAREQHKAA